MAVFHLCQFISPTSKLLPLALAALGVVFGDIGTSPLYTLQVAIAPESGRNARRAESTEMSSASVLLIVWALTAVVTVKYLLFIMRADNQGEGGILALLALVPMKKHARIGVGHRCSSW